MPEEPWLEEYKSGLSGGLLAEKAVREKIVEDDLYDEYGLDLPIDPSLDGN